MGTETDLIGPAVHLSDAKVNARNQAFYTHSVLTREEVCKQNYVRRLFQQSNEGLFAPITKPYRALGDPIYMDNHSLITSALGTIPKKPDVLHSNLTEEEKTGLDPLEAEDTLVEIPEVDTLQLSDASIRKALEQLRPASTKQRGSISTGEGSKAASKYMERRRKCGTVDVHDVWKQSNLSVRLVERGVSFFGILSDEMCDKIHQFWEERGRYARQRTTRIQPPNRKHLLLFSAESSHLPPDAKLKEVVEQLTEEEQHIEEEELREHQLAMQEPDIQNLTEQLLQAGVSLADSSLCHPTNDSQYRLTKSASERKSLAASARFGRSKIEDAVIDRRRRRLKDLWIDEQPRPFTPMYFNICRPNVGRSTENAPEIEEYSEPKDEHNEFTSESETHVEQRETRRSLKSKSELSLQGEDVPYFLSDVLHAQLCCLLWLLRRMTTNEEEEKFTVPRPISMCWNYRDIASNEATQSGAPQLKGNEPKATDQEWYKFLIGSERTTGQKTKRSTLYGQSPLSETPATTSSCDGSGTQSRRSTYGNRKGNNGKRPSFNSTVQTVRTISQGIPEETSPSVSQSASFRSTLTSAVAARAPGYKFHLLHGIEEQQPSKPLITAEGDSQHNVQFAAASDLLGSIEKTKNAPMIITSNTWITVSELRQKFPKEELSEMARKIVLEMDKEEAEQRTNRVTRSKRPVDTSTNPIKPTDGVQTQSNSHKWERTLEKIRSELASLLELKAMKFQDRIEYMKQLRAKVCLAKYRAIPDHSTPVHLALQRIQQKAPYATAVQRLARSRDGQREYAAWYVDLLHDLDHMCTDPKVASVLTDLELYGQFPPSKFTVLHFTRALLYMTVWELCIPVVSAAVDFVRARVLDMTLDEYRDWLYATYPELKEGLVTD